MSIELYNRDGHICLMFADLADDKGAVVQANQFMIGREGQVALLDPGGELTFNGINVARHRYFSGKDLTMILASHADPDIVASLNKWMTLTECVLYVPKVWSRFVPHFCNRDYTQRIHGIPDAGAIISFGSSHLKALPAHFLHSEGNFQFYDPVSKILFSGDLGASLTSSEDIAAPVTDFESHLPAMEPFHRRYMNSNKVCRYWVQMVRQLDIEWIVPQHGRSFKGKAMIERFLQWVENLQCGIDLMTQSHYSIPQVR